MHPLSRLLSATTLALSATLPVMAADLLIVDDRSSGSHQSSLGTGWRLVTDGVMGGVSNGQLLPDTIAGRPCLHMTGSVRLENNGGFVQAALDLAEDRSFDASGYDGLELAVYGNDEQYNLHLRTDDVWLPWQSYRASFVAEPRWQTLRLPFSGFTPYRIGADLDLSRLERIGVVAIGRAFEADLCIGGVALYRDAGSGAPDGPKPR
jgi:hypothetical protein